MTTKKKENFVVWAKVKVGRESKSDDSTTLIGAFTNAMSEIKKGNKLKGVTLKQGEIGFVFGDEPEFIQQEPPQEEPKKWPSVTVEYISTSRVGKSYQLPTVPRKEGQKGYTIQEMPVLDTEWKQLIDMSKKTGKSIDEVCAMLTTFGGIAMFEYLVDDKSFEGQIAMKTAQALLTNVLGLKRGSIGISRDPGIQKELKDFAKMFGDKATVINIGRSPSPDEDELPDEVKEFLAFMRKHGAVEGTIEKKNGIFNDEQSEAISELRKKNKSDSFFKKLRNLFGNDND